MIPLEDSSNNNTTTIQIILESRMDSQPLQHNVLSVTTPSTLGSLRKTPNRRFWPILLVPSAKNNTTVQRYESTGELIDIGRKSWERSCKAVLGKILNDFKMTGRMIMEGLFARGFE